MKKVRLHILYTFLSHFLIVFGFAHAGAFIGLIEVLYFPYFTEESFSLLLVKTQESYLPAVGLLGFLGNILLLIAVLVRESRIRTSVYVVGLLVYWISIFYLWYDSTIIGNTQFSYLFCIPLLIFSLLPLISKRLTGYNGWLKN